MSLTGFLSYSRVNWQQSPSKSTPLSAANLNLMDAGIKNNNDMISNLRDEITQLNSNLKGLIYSDFNNGTKFIVPISCFRKRRTYGMAILSAWQNLYAIFYISENSSMFVKKIAGLASESKNPTVTYDKDTESIIINFQETVWYGISILPF